MYAMTEQDRRAVLNTAITWETNSGARVVSWSPFEVTVVRAVQRPNHILHLLLALFTFGLWLVIWAVACMLTPQPKLLCIGVDEFGTQ